MTYRRPNYIPCIVGASMGSPAASFTVGLIRSFFLPPNVTTTDKMRLISWHYSSSATTGTYHVGKNADPAGGAASAALLADFGTAVTGNLEASGEGANMTFAKCSEVEFAVTSDMVTHAAAGTGFSLAFKSNTSTNMACFCVTLLLDKRS